MSDKKFDLNKFLQSPKLSIPIDYSGITIPNTSETQEVVQNFEDWRKSQGYKTEEEKQEELKSRITEIQERTKDLGDGDSTTDWYHAMVADDPEAIAEWDRQAAAVTGHGVGAIVTIASAGTLGWVPSLISTAGGYAGGYGGYKAGEYIDNKYGTNTAPWLSLAGGLVGGVGGYKGLVKAGSAGLLKGSGQMYGKQFIGDVTADTFNKNVKTFNIDAAVNSARKLETMQKLRNSGQTLDPYYQAGVDQNIVPDDLPEYILPLSQLKQDYPKAQLVPLGKQTNVWSLDGNPLVSGKNVGYDHPLRGTQHRVLKIGNKQYYVGTDPVKNQGSNILIHQGDLPMSGSKIVPIEGDTGITKIWWEQNAPFYGKIDAPKAKAGTYVIDDVIPTEYALERSGIFGSKHSVLSDAVDLADPNINFKFFTYDPISGEMVQSPFALPKRQITKGSYTWFKRPSKPRWANTSQSKLTEWERLGIPKGDRNFDVQFGIARREGDINRMQQLRDQHHFETFQKNKLVQDGRPVDWYYGSDDDFTVFDLDRTLSPNFFFSKDKNYVMRLMREKGKQNPIIKKYYLYSENPASVTNPRGLNHTTTQWKKYEVPDSDSFIGADTGKDEWGFSLDPTEIAIPYPRHIKSASPIVYDDNGHFIKLSKRDDIWNKDVRYQKGGKINPQQ